MNRYQLLVFCAIIALTGVQCNFLIPERKSTFLPPTSEEELCQSDKRFYYSSSFRFCFPLPTQFWQEDILVSLPKSFSGTTTSTVDFFVYDEEFNTVRMFTLYINRLTQENKQFFKETGIDIVFQDSGLLLGIVKPSRDNLSEKLQAEYDYIDQMIKSIRVF